MRRFCAGVSAISGNGLFTGEAFRAGEFILAMTGEEFPLERMEEICRARGLSVNMPLHTALDRVLFLDRVPNLINHSCEPNCGLRNRADLFAIRDIVEGEEITYDYSTNVGPGIEWSMAPCRCGATACRQVIRNVAALPEAVLRRYLALDAVQDFIRHLVAASEAGSEWRGRYRRVTRCLGTCGFPPPAAGGSGG
jgi:hypothetical protein